MFSPSEKQLAIFHQWEIENSNILINAVAGSGKTTTLMQLLERCRYRTLFLAFNKSIQEEIQGQINEKGLNQGKAMTIHALGLSAIRNEYKKLKINNGKNFDILKKVQDEFQHLFRRLDWKDKVRFGYTLMDMNDVSRISMSDDMNTIMRLFDSMGKSSYEHDRLQQVWERFVELRYESYDVDSTGILEIDFTDMIYLPVHKELYIPVEPTFLMVDEAQDLSLCQHTLIDMLLRQGSIQRWIAVGDRNQSIYGFSGAFSTSFDLFLDKGNVIELPLDICYRCPSLIVESANEVYPVMEAFKEDEGIVEDINDPLLIKENSMIICRNSNPLISLYFNLLGQGKECYIKGEDILNDLLRFMKPYARQKVGDARREMTVKLDEMNRNTTDSGRIQSYVFKDNFDNFLKLAEHLAQDWETVDTLSNKVKALFIDKDNAIMLCTIHKSKGLEADIVYILNENLIPSRYAKSTEQLRQEENLRYVARTRAKKELYFLKYNL